MISLLFLLSVGNVGDCGHQRGRNLHYNQWHCLRDRLWLCEAAGLQPKDSHRMFGGGASVPGVSQPAGRAWWTQPLRKVLPPLYRLVWLSLRASDFLRVSVGIDFG
jgi:hypothetical protein